MNREQLYTALRSLLAIGLGILVGRGTITAEQAATITSNVAIVLPALGALAVAAFSIWKRSDSNLVKTTGATVTGVKVQVDATASPEVKALAADPNVANVERKP